MTIVFILVNVLLVGLAGYFFFKKNLLSYPSGGQWWLTWLAIGIITLMDELTSIFYAPSEAFRHIGPAALVFIPVTAFIVHYMTTRMVEISEILDHHNLKGGGVYNFSYLVLGPVISFVAVSSIMVDYVLTAAISTVSAVENASYFFTDSPNLKLAIEMGFIWGVAGLNILGIRANTRVIFGIFLITAIAFINILIGAAFDFSPGHVDNIGRALGGAVSEVTSKGIFHGYGFVVAAVSSCILAYSGVESVMQTASLVKNWKVVAKAYWFLALSVGILIPVVAVLVLSTPGINFKEHESDLIIHYATMLNGQSFGLFMAVVASVTLLMAMNTAFVASSELMERVAHRYHFNWLLKTNRFTSLYRVHIWHALVFSVIVIATQGKLPTLAEMYAVGLVATFVINLLCLLIYRYSRGTTEVREFNSSRVGTLIFFILILSCFLYLAYHKWHGFALWLGATVFSLIVGIYGTRNRSPEKKAKEKGESPMDIIFFIAESTEDNINLYFKRPFDNPQEKTYGLPIFITFYSPRQGVPERLGPNHFRIPFKRASIFNNIAAVLHLIQYELAGKNLTVHFGWPTASWFDRLSTGVMVFQFMKLPKQFPQVNFKMEKFKV